MAALRNHGKRGSTGAPENRRAGDWYEHYRKAMVHWSNNLLVLALMSAVLAVFGPGLVGLLFSGGDMGVRFGFVVSPCLLVLGLVSLIGALLMRRAARRSSKGVVSENPSDGRERSE